MALNTVEPSTSPAIVGQLQITTGLDAGAAETIAAIAAEMMAVRTKKEIIVAIFRFVFSQICLILPHQYSISTSQSTAATGS